MQAEGLDTEAVFFDDGFETVPDVKLTRTRWPVDANGVYITGSLGEQGPFTLAVELKDDMGALHSIKVWGMGGWWWWWWWW